MKKQIWTIVTLIVSILSIPAFADTGLFSSSKDVKLVKVTETPEYPEKEGQEGNRKPSLPIYCNIDATNGIQPKYIVAEIIQYQVLDSDGNVIASFDCEQEFVDFIFGTCAYSNIKIKLCAENYYYIGSINID